MATAKELGACRRAVPHDLAVTERYRGLGGVGGHRLPRDDQVRFLLHDQVTEVSGRTRTFTTRRPGANGLEEVTVDDAAWATLTLASGAIASVEASRVAAGQKNALKLEIYGDKGSLLFDLENLNELMFLDATLPVREQGFRRILVSEPERSRRRRSRTDWRSSAS